jgi:putative ATP-dependent endonuclease of OLD family
MRILKVIIKNYRNLDGTEMYFNPEINFLIGENDLGKSNFLDMLDTIFNKRSFPQGDFTNSNEPIEIEFSLLLSEKEKGIFEDYFDPERSDVVNIKAKQEDPDEDIKFFHKESEEEIHYSRLRCLNFIKYDSLRLPKEEFTFYKGRGVGRFLSYLVDKIISTDAKVSDYIKTDELQPIVDSINETFKKIRVFKEFEINTFIEEKLTDLIYRILSIKDSKGIEIQKIGHGIQFSILIILFIMEKLMRMVEDKRRNECIFTDGDKKSISLILGMDEPEIHLHPYMQRSLIKFVNNLLTNKEEQFSLLVKELFDIDSFDGQAIIVSHSPNILLNNYKYIVRFYKKKKEIKITSGEKVDLALEIEKHLLRNFLYIKEAFFSKCAIIVEGDTEFGALPLWGEKVVGSLDELGITVIHGGGANSIPPITKMLNNFNLSNVSIIDRDVYHQFPTKYNGIDNLNITNKKDFEEELVDSIFASGQLEVLFELVKQYDTQGLGRIIQRSKLEDIARNYGIKVSLDNNKDYKFSELLETDDRNLTKTMFLAWLNINKSIILGRVIGETIDESYIPTIYKTTIEQAKTLAIGHGRNN